MNERIKQLADQALKECDAAKERGIDQYSKRFAELIVLECAEVAKNSVMNISTYADAEFVSGQINQHFGV